MRSLKTKHYFLGAVMMAAFWGFGIHFLRNANYEFLIYIGVIFFAALLIAGTDRIVRYPFICLSGLVLWGIMHLAGGGISINGHVLYEQILVSISEKYSILRYDQVVHAFGFGVCVLLFYHLLSRWIKPEDRGRFSVGLTVIAAGCGLGAINENIEFLLTVFLPQTGVGGYINTSLDLWSNLIGSISAWLLIRLGGPKLFSE